MKLIGKKLVLFLLILAIGKESVAIDRWTVFGILGLSALVCVSIAANKHHTNTLLKYKFFKAVVDNDIETVKDYIKKGRIDVNKTFHKSSLNALHIVATNKKYFELMKFLIEDGKADVNIKDNALMTPLFYCKNSNPEAAKLLIKNKADVNAQSEAGRTPLIWHTRQNNLEIMKILIEDGKADVNISDNHGDAPLHYCNNNPEAIKLLLKHKANVNVQDKDGDTLLHSCAFHNQPEAMKVLIEDGKTDVNIKNNTDNTPLHYCRNNPIGAQLLIKNKADVNAQGKMGETPLHLYAFHNQPEVMKILIEYGKANVNIQDNKGKTPLHYCRNNPISVQLLIKNKANVNIQDNNGRTPLHYCRNPQIAALLINHGANVNLKDRDGRIPEDSQLIDDETRSFLENHSLSKRLSNDQEQEQEQDKKTDPLHQKLLDDLNKNINKESHTRPARL